MKSILSFVFAAIISLPFVSLIGFYDSFGQSYGYLPQKYVSSYLTPGYYDSSIVEPHTFGGYYYYPNNYISSQIVYPTNHYNYAPLVPLNYHQSLFSPINHYGLGGYRIVGPGLPTHPGYRPPTMWKRIWPPTNGTNDTTGTDVSSRTDVSSGPDVPSGTDMSSGPDVSSGTEVEGAEGSRTTATSDPTNEENTNTQSE